MQTPEMTVLQAALLAVPPLVPSPLSPLHTLPNLEPAVSTQGQRLRKVNILSLNMCTCGVTITNSEINVGINLMKC